MSVLSVLDRVFVSNDWESRYNMANLFAPTRIGSDHNSLIVDIGDRVLATPKPFRFDPSWLLQDGFKEWVLERWPQRYKHNILDHWHVVSSRVRRLIKGWGRNFDSDIKKKKKELLVQIQSLDGVADSNGLSKQEWAVRYDLENQLQQILHVEAVYWQKRSGEKWLLEGDSNTSYFQKCANGRRRKHIIQALEWEGEVISEAEKLKAHVIEYYKKLFGKEETSNIHLHEDSWGVDQRLSEEDNAELTKPFTLEELD